MSNADLCRLTAANYARLANAAQTDAVRESYRGLQRLWLEIASLAEEFDASGETAARERVYAMIDGVQRLRQTVH